MPHGGKLTLETSNETARQPPNGLTTTKPIGAGSYVLLAVKATQE